MLFLKLVLIYNIDILIYIYSVLIIYVFNLYSFCTFVIFCMQLYICGEGQCKLSICLNILSWVELLMSAKYSFYILKHHTWDGRRIYMNYCVQVHQPSTSKFVFYPSNLVCPACQTAIVTQLQRCELLIRRWLMVLHEPKGVHSRSKYDPVKIYRGCFVDKNHPKLN